MITEEDFARDQQIVWRSDRNIVRDKTNTQQNKGVDTMDQVRWLKHRINGRVLQYTDILAGHEDMIECDKNGNVLTMRPRTIERPKERFLVKDGQTVLQSVKQDVVIVRPGEDLSAMSLEERITICRDIEELAQIAAELGAGIPSNMSLQEAKQNLVDMLPEIREQQAKEAARKKEAWEKKRAEEEAAKKAKPKTIVIGPVEKPLLQQINEATTVDELNVIAKKFDVAFADGLPIAECKTGLLDYLKGENIISKEDEKPAAAKKKPPKKRKAKAKKQEEPPAAPPAG